MSVRNVLVRSGKELQGGEHGAGVFLPPFSCCSCIPFAKLPNPTFLHWCFLVLPEAPSAEVWILCFVVQAQGTLCINLGNSLRMVTGNLLIAMETWACYKLFRFALGHMFGTCWLWARSPWALGLSNARQLILLPAPKGTGNSESFIPEQ